MARPTNLGKAAEAGPSTRAPVKPDPVLLDWVETFHENRGLDLPAEILNDVDYQARSRETMASFEGTTPYPLPDYFDRVAAKEIPSELILEELRNGYSILKDRPIRLYETDSGEEGQEVDVSWVTQQPEEAVTTIRRLAAQRDTATSVLEALRHLIEQRIATLQVTLQRARELEARVEDLEGTLAQQKAEVAHLIDKAQLQEELLGQYRQSSRQSRQASTGPLDSGTADRVTDRSTERNCPLPSTETARGGSPVPVTAKTAKIADPDKFTDGKSPTLSVWKAQLKCKFNGNRELFPTEDSKFGYATSYISGEVQENLEPFLSEDCLEEDRITNVDELLVFLENAYKDPTELARAKRDFKDLAIDKGGKTVSYRDFVIKFNHLVVKARIPKSEWKEEFNQRLSRRLQYGMTREFIDDSIDYTEFVRLGYQYSLQYDNYSKSDNKKVPTAEAAVAAKMPLAGTRRIPRPRATAAAVAVAVQLPGQPLRTTRR